MTCRLVLQCTMALQKEDIVAALLLSLIGVSTESNNNPAKLSSSTCGLAMRSWSVTYNTCSICALRGSSVELSSTFEFPHGETLKSTVWHVYWPAGRGEPTCISKDTSYHNRVKNHTHERQSTLTIRDLRDSDSRMYHFRILTHSNRFSGVPGIQVSVTGLLVTASPYPVIEGGFAKLTCSTNCTLSGHPTYVWYKNGQPHRQTTEYNYYLYFTSASTEDSGSYSCAVRGKDQLISPSLLIDVRYSPKNTLAYVYPLGDVSEGTSVALVCSSFANPPVHKYSWFKRNRTGYVQIESTGQNYNIPSVSRDHSGEYFCTAANTVGEATSHVFQLNVTYPPRSPTTVVSPGDVVEGISMTLTCSSEAKPAVHTYTWYWKSGAHSSKLRVGQNYSIPNVTCGHSGEYHCQAENLKGSTNSTPVFVDVLYPPRNLSVFVSSFDGVVTLTCSSDANPVVTHYTWHKRTGTDTSPRGTGRNLTLDSGESGLYYCQAKNGIGATESNLLSISEKNTVGRYAAVVAVAVGALIVIVSILLRIRQKKMSVAETTEDISDGEQDGSGPVYVNVSRVAVTSGPKSSADTESESHYTSVYFKQCDKKEVPLYSTLGKPKVPLVEDEVLYSTVRFHH